MGYPTRIDLCDGKYSVVFNFETGRSEALRYGERWRDLRGDKMVLAMFNRIVELEEQLKTCEKPDTDLADDVTKGMRRAWYLGQKYWMLGDSESRSDHRKADETEKKFEELMKEIRDLVLIRGDAMKGGQ